MTREEYARIAKLQDEFIAEQEMVRDRRLHRQRAGASARRRRLSIERANANIAGHAAEALLRRGRERRATPRSRSSTRRTSLAPGYPDDRCIAVDLEDRRHPRHGLRLLRRVEEGRPADVEHDRLRPRRPGAARRAARSIPVNGDEKVFLIIGLSGTGKTTTTFTTQNDSLPVQDDFVALMPGGKVYGSRGRLLREDVLARPRLRAEHLQRGHQAQLVPGERLPGRRRHGELLRGARTRRTAARCSR